MVAGAAGQGVQSSGDVLAKALARGGYDIFSDQDYESRIRGGDSFSRIRVRDVPVRAIAERLDMLLALDRDNLLSHKDMVSFDGVIIYDGERVQGIEEDGRLLGMPLEKLAVEATGAKVAANTVAVGAATALMDYEFDVVASVVAVQFANRGIGDQNVRAARAGYDYVKANYSGKFPHRLRPMRPGSKMLISGNEALALGALAAGCKFYAGYPMTPSTTILEYMSTRADAMDVVVVQPEDEIAAANMAVGAAFAGVRAMTATSGSGFALMVEALGLAGMTETPVVMVDAQRPAPAVGLPTRTEQGDLQFVLSAAPGDFPRAVLAPVNIEDCFWLTVRAFNIAEKYQMPVIVLTDHFLASSYATVEPFDLSQVRIERGALLTDEELATIRFYKRHQITDTGISPRALPMQSPNVLVVSDADEHDEEGHLTESAHDRAQQVAKRMRKLDLLAREVAPPKLYGPPGAETALLAWGSTYETLKETVDILRAEGADVNLLQFNELSPFPAGQTEAALAKAKRVIVVENNATGQFARLLRAETGIRATAKVLRFDGRPFTPAGVARELKEVLR